MLIKKITKKNRARRTDPKKIIDKEGLKVKKINNKLILKMLMNLHLKLKFFKKRLSRKILRKKRLKDKKQKKSSRGLKKKLEINKKERRSLNIRKNRPNKSYS